MNKYGYGDSFLNKLKKVENVNKSHKLNCLYLQVQINDICK
jgi:hypothetical protein